MSILRVVIHIILDSGIESVPTKRTRLQGKKNVSKDLVSESFGSLKS